MEKKEEIRVLERLSKSPPAKRRLRSKSQPRLSRNRSRKSINRSHEELPHLKWTNSYSRQSVHWDSTNGLLRSERKKVIGKIEKHPMRCCGNSPGKSHKQFCETVRPGEHLLKSIKGLSFGQPRKERQNIIAAALLPQFKGKSKNYSRSRSQPKSKSKNRKGTANKTTAKPMRRKLEYNNENEFE